MVGPELENQPLERAFLKVSPGIELHYVEAGEGELVVLLHGFPEFWYTWRHQIVALVEAGYRVVAPDLRGYNESTCPEELEAYRLEHLARDVANLIEGLGEERAIVVGHDWGGVVAWELAMHHPERVKRLAVLNAPHPSRFARALKTVSQLRRSWYIVFFQLPVLPELLLARNNWAALRGVFRTAARRDAFSREDLAHYITAFSKPGVATAALNYYRAGARFPRRSSAQVRCPVRVIWGRKDSALGEELADPGERLACDREICFIEDAGHWVQNESPERVSALLLEFFAARE